MSFIMTEIVQVPIVLHHDRIVLKNPKATGSIRVVRTEEGTDSTRVEMTDLLEVLIGANVNENLVVMVDNQSILR